MKEKKLAIVLLIIFLTGFGLSKIAYAQMQAETHSCETCPMMVGAEAQEHLKVYDGNGTRHWVECIGCALKLLNSYDSLHIETYCDWYGPNYNITIDISQHGASTTVTPNTALLLIGGGCTGNRVAYNQTAADNLMSNGFSQYTMKMMQQTLPSNTNTTTFPARAKMLTANDVDETENPSILAPALIAVIGVTTIILSVVAYKKLRK